MSELSLLITLGLFRVITGAFIIAREKLLNEEKHILVTFLVSFFYSSIFTWLFLFLFRPILFCLMIVFESEFLLDIFIPVYLFGGLFFIFFIELKNNLICLNNVYTDNEIKKSTTISYFLSVLGIAIYFAQ